MRLHRLRLVDVRGVTERTIEFPDADVVVVEGPNEVGKTTMIEALDLLLDEKDSSRKRQVQAIRPVGRDVSSSIEAELSSGPYRFTYRKRWFRQPATELTITAPRREHLTGVEAHERVVSMLAQSADLVLWRALRLMQAAPLIQADLSGSSALASALDAAAAPSFAGQADPVRLGRSGAGALATDAAGAETQAVEFRPGAEVVPSAAAPEADGIVAAAEAEYRRYFTPGQGQPTGEYRAARDRLEAAVVAATQARDAVQEVAHDVDRHAVVLAETAAFQAELDDATAAADDLQDRWDAVEALVDAAHEAQRLEATAQRDAQRARDRWHERRSRGRALAEEEAALADQAAAAAEVAGRLAPREAELAALTARLRHAQALAQRARRDHEAAAARQARSRDAADLDALEERLRRLARLAADRTAALAELETSRVDRAALAEIERAAVGLDVAVATLNAGSTRVTVTALADDTALTLDGVSLPLAAGQRHEQPVTEPIALELPGRIRLDVIPEAGAHLRIEAVDAARAELTRLLESAGADDLDHARRLHERREEAQASRRRVEEVRADLLAGAREEDLAERAAVLRATLARSVPAAPADPAAPAEPDPADPADDDRPAEETDLAEHAEELARRVHLLREDIEALRLEVTKSVTLVEAIRGQLVAERARLEASREVEPDEALRGAADQADRELAQAQAARREAAAALRDHDPQSLRVRLDAARSALPGLRERRSALRDERIAIEARLAAAGSQGRQERLDAAEQERVHAQAAYDAIDRRARAARLLCETLQRRRTEAKRAYVAPYADELRRFGRIVYGSDFDVEVADDLSITARALHGRSIEYGALSTGAKEQLAILTRLACATLVDPEQGVPVIIDDALGYSDPQRLRRICAAFSLRRPGAQLVLLTCTPGRYAQIPGSSVIRLADSAIRG